MVRSQLLQLLLSDISQNGIDLIPLEYSACSSYVTCGMSVPLPLLREGFGQF